jgi:hypothetical protein
MVRLLCLCVGVVLLAGCSGINATHSISPASFLLPGLLQNDPRPAQPDPLGPAEEPLNEVAQF